VSLLISSLDGREEGIKGVDDDVMIDAGQPCCIIFHHLLLTKSMVIIIIGYDFM